MPRIVISYRRADRADRLTTRRIWEKLEAKYGEGSAFMDTETMRPGKDFRAQIAEALRGADAMLVMVGEKWLGPRSGQHRINEPTDWVRIEVETALATHVPIFPVLIGKGRMPGVEQLPESLKDFAYIQAAHVDEEKNFHSDVDQLFDWIDHAIEERRSLQEAKALEEQRALEQRRAIEDNARAEQRAEEQRKSIEAQRALERQLALAAEQAREEQEALAAKRAADEKRALEEQRAVDDEKARAAQRALDEQKALEARQVAERQRAADEAKAREAQKAAEDKKRQDEQRALDEKRERETKPDVPEELVAAVQDEPRRPRRLRHPLALTGIGGAVVLLLGAAVIAGPSIWASLTDSSRKYSLDSDSGGAAVDMPVGGSAASQPPKVATAPVPSTAPPAVAPKAIDSPAAALPRVAAPVPTPPVPATPTPRPPETTGARPPSVAATKARPLGAGAATCGVRAASTATDSALPSFAPNELTKLRALAVSHDGSRIATAGDDRVIRIWDTANLKLIEVLHGHTDAVYSLDFWSERRLLASAGWDGKVRLWDLDTGGVTVLEDGARPATRFYAVAFYPGKPLKTLSHVAASGLDGIVRIWNVNNPSAPPSIKDDHNIRMGGRDPRPNDKRDADEFNTARALSYVPTGTGEFATAGYDGTIRVHRTTGRKVDTVDAHGGKVLSLAYSPDGRRIISAGSGKDRRDQQVLRLWNAETGRLIRPLEDHNLHVVVAIWSPNGNSIASGGGDKSIKIWNPETGKVVLTIDRAHGADIEALAYTPDGNRLISVGEDGLMRIWDLQAGGALLLSAAAHGASDFISYAPPGCYTGSHGSERYLRAAIGNRLNPGATPQAQHIPEGFALIR